MKKIIASGLLSLAVVISTHAQGTVTFANDSTSLSSPPDRLVRFNSTASTVNPLYVAGAPVFSNANTGLRAILYYGSSTAAEGSLVAVTTAPSTFKNSASPNVGTWFTLVGVPLTGFNPGDTVNLQVRVWDISLASSYEAAVASGLGLQGKSTTFLYTIPSGATTPAQFIMGSGNPGVFSSFTIGVVPEPSTIALAGLGAAALLIFRRRK
jgi:hypothetical protein